MSVGLEEQNKHKKARHTLRTISTLIPPGNVPSMQCVLVYTDSKGGVRGLRKSCETRLNGYIAKG